MHKLKWRGHVFHSSGLAKGLIHLARHSERRKKTRQTEEEREDDIASGQAWSLPSLRGQWRTEKDGRNWL